MTRLSDAETFFYDNAGYSYDPATETREEGRRRCAREMANDEEWLRNSDDVRSQWGDDDSGDHSYLQQDEFRGYQVTTCEFCSILDETGSVIYASLGCIDDADDNYRRVIESELAGEARPAYAERQAFLAVAQ